MGYFSQMNMFIVLALFVNGIYGCSNGKRWLGKRGMQGLGIGKKIENQPKLNPNLIGPKIKISILLYL